MVANQALAPFAQAMVAAAVDAFTQLAGTPASAGAIQVATTESSLRIEPDVVATLTTIPSAGVSFVTRFAKADLGAVVEMMLGTPGGNGELDAMHLSIVAETSAQVATAMGERLAAEIWSSPDHVHSEVLTSAANVPAPPFTSFAATIILAPNLRTVVTLDVDGLAAAKLLGASNATTVADPVVSPARPSMQGQAAQFPSMSPSAPRPQVAGARPKLDLVHDVPLEISAVLGQTEMSLRDVVAMGPGSVFELDKLATEPIDLYVNNILIARGEVVVVDDKFAVKINELNPVVDKL